MVFVISTILEICFSDKSKFGNTILKELCRTHILLIQLHINRGWWQFGCIWCSCTNDFFFKRSNLPFAPTYFEKSIISYLCLHILRIQRLHPSFYVSNVSPDYAHLQHTIVSAYVPNKFAYLSQNLIANCLVSYWLLGRFFSYITQFFQ